MRSEKIRKLANRYSGNAHNRRVSRRARRQLGLGAPRIVEVTPTHTLIELPTVTQLDTPMEPVIVKIPVAWWKRMLAWLWSFIFRQD